MVCPRAGNTGVFLLYICETFSECTRIINVHQYHSNMRVINVVVIKAGVVDSINSFGVFEEQLVDDVVKPAEELFIQKAKDNGYDGEEDKEELLDMGYFEFYDGSVCISWSDI